MKNTINPFVMVIFGATGDLTRKKLMPALFKMYREGFLGDNFRVVAVARRDLGNEGYGEMIKESSKFKVQSSKWEGFAEHIIYHQGFFEEGEMYERLGKVLKELEKEMKEGVTRYFYLATPPSNYETILTNLERSGIAGPASARGYGEAKKGNGRVRILIEKPFGKDADDARKLEGHLARTFHESQIYRIDHYLGKEAIQNIIAFRFANGIFEPIWNKDYIDHVQITMAESAGLENRIGFYEGVGALRDVMQNHMLEMLALVAMEQPRSFSTDSVRDARARAIVAIRPIGEEDAGKYVVRGQYGAAVGGTNSKFEIRNSKLNEKILGYREEKGVDPKSNTETYVAMKVMLDTPRWQGVPWYLRTGKRLPKDAVEISIVFKQTCHILFREIGCPEEGNILTLRVSPHEGIGVRFIVKQPGHEFKLKDVDMDFNFREVFQDDRMLEAYERILEDIFRSDQMLFNRSDEMEGSWRIINPIIKAWMGDSGGKLHFYTAGSWGPEEADALIEKDGRKWVLR